MSHGAIQKILEHSVVYFSFNTRQSQSSRINLSGTYEQLSPPGECEISLTE